MSVDDLRAKIASLGQERIEFADELAAAVLAGDDTSPCRANLAGTDKAIASFESELAEVERAEAERRRGMVEATARDIASESIRRHAALMEALMPPPAPAEIKEFSL